MEAGFDPPPIRPSRPLAKRILGLTSVILVNAIPAAGVFGRSWPVGTALALYWTETLLSAFVVLLLIRIWSIGRDGAAAHLRGTVGATLVLHAGTLIMLVALIFLAFPHYERGEGFDVTTYVHGLALICAVIVLEFAFLSRGIRDKTALELETSAGSYMNRFLIFFFTVLLGAAALAIFGSLHAMFGVLTDIRPSS